MLLSGIVSFVSISIFIVDFIIWDNPLLARHIWDLKYISCHFGKLSRQGNLIKRLATNWRVKFSEKKIYIFPERFPLERQKSL